MTFNTAVSGLRAASDDLGVISNNVANASTGGFKSSRSEFGDVYAAASSNQVGGGVLLKNIAQQHSQGTISFTENSLDMAINGSGFFILDNDGERSYSRAGYFGLDRDGNMVNNSGKSVMGYPANAAGDVERDELEGLSITTENIEPNPTSSASFVLNVDAQSLPPATRGTTVEALGLQVGQAQVGAQNGYASEVLTFTNSDSNTTDSITTVANASAAEIASQINSVNGVTAEAFSEVTLSGLVTDSGNMEVSVNGVLVGSGFDELSDIAVTINNLTSTTLSGITALVTGGALTITSSRGDDIDITINTTGSALDRIDVNGQPPLLNPLQLSGDGLLDGLSATVGGAVEVTMGQGISLTSSGDGSGIFAATIAAEPFTNNDFDPENQDSYNHSSSANIYDSQGASHVLTVYYVKETALNTWTAYALVDGQDVGDPNAALEPPLNEVARRASFNLEFNPDGTLNNEASDALEISYWNPVDENGDRTGAEGGQAIGTDGLFEVDVMESSNFRIDLDGSTQFGSAFSVNSIAQDGYATGRLLGLDIDQEGIIFSRFSNGQTRVLGQVALANFNNPSGLTPAGDTEWVESFGSGVPNPGSPGAASLGLVQAGAIEDSNVDLSQELVKMIVAQRNFQANARTIQTADTITQAIINIR